MNQNLRTPQLRPLVALSGLRPRVALAGLRPLVALAGLRPLLALLSALLAGVPNTAVAHAPQAHERSACSATSEGTDPTAPTLRQFLSRAKAEITSETLQEAFCEEPQTFCDTVRNLSIPEHEIAFGSPQMGDGAALPSTFLLRNSLATEEGQNLVVEELQNLSGTEQPLLQPLFEGNSWNRLENLYQSAQSSLIEHLSQPHLSTPEVVIEKIRGLRLLNPFDGSVPLEQRKELMASCGLSEDWELPNGRSVGDFNAFANSDGFIVLCPQMILGQNNEGLMTILIHEIAHQIGPCLVGGAILAQLSGPQCEVNSQAQPEISPWIDWHSRTRRLEQCFHEAGLNEGRDAEWLSRILQKDTKRDEELDLSATSTEGCPQTFIQHLAPSSDPLRGLVASCDPSQFHLVIQMFAMLEKSELQALEHKTLRDRARALQLQVRVLHSMVRATLPSTNQFNEAMSDVFAAQLLGPALQNYRARTSTHAPDPTSTRQNILSGLSSLCSPKKMWSHRGEAHSRDDRRMQIFASQAGLRELVGCGSPPSRGLSRRLSKCHGLGL